MGTILRALISWRVLYVSALYLGALWAVVEFTDWLAQRHAFAVGLTEPLLLLGVILIPSVAFLASRHGRREKARWRLDMAVVVGNVILAAGIVVVTTSKEHFTAVAEAPPQTPVTREITTHGRGHGPSLAPDGARLVYSRRDSADFDALMLVDLSTNEERELLRVKRILSGSNAFSDAQWTRDGSMVAIEVRDSIGGAAEIVLVSVRDGGSKRLRGEAVSALEDRHFALSPDGSRVATVPVRYANDIVITDVTTGHSATLPAGIEFPLVRAVRWSPAGNLLAVETNHHSGRFRIFTLAVDGSAKNVVAEDDVFLGTPRWTPSGDGLVFSRIRLLRHVGIDPITGVALTAMPGDSVGDLAPSPLNLSVDAGRMTFGRYRGRRTLWRVNLRDGNAPEATRLPGGRGSRSPVAGSKDRIAFREGGSVYAMPIGGGPVSEIMTVPGSSYALSPDWQRVAFVVPGGETGHLAVAALDRAQPRVFDDTRVAGASQLTWCGSDKVAFTTETTRNMTVVDLHSGDSRPLLESEPDGVIRWPRCSPDGSRVAVYWNRRDGYGLWVISLVDGAARMILHGQTLAFQWSEDGEWIYASPFLSGKLVRIPAAGGDPVLLAMLPFRETDVSRFLAVGMPPAFVFDIGDYQNDVIVLEGVNLSIPEQARQ